MKKNFLLLLVLASCQSLQEADQRYMETLCTYDGAYSKGVEDAQKGENSQATSALSYCPSETKAEALRGYNDGYAAITEPDNSPGGIFGQVLKSTGIIKELYNCEIEVFTETFSAKGRSKQEAIYKAKQVCTAERKDDIFFCKDVSKYHCTKVY